VDYIFPIACVLLIALELYIQHFEDTHQGLNPVSNFILWFESTHDGKGPGTYYGEKVRQWWLRK
jgi:hypothetical protein